MAKEESFARLELVLGQDRLNTLRDSCVYVLGLGGVGSSCAEALARGGVGTLVLIDRDVVSASNINRQALAFHSTIGKPKAQVMRDMVLDINPGAQVFASTMFVEKERVGEQLAAFPAPNYVVDAIDTISQKLAVARWCQDEGIPLVSSMGGANKLDPCRLRFARIEKTSGDGLARVMRKECRKRGIRNLRVLFSDEPAACLNGPRTSEPGKRPPKGSDLGTLSYYPPIMGQMLASWVIRELVGLL
ncbi:MAG: tRNA threonylcarbamoyladenosine dehydratase [Coriobacteriales bacterium]|nr:tRNA threonylcarbamoyladenosine dehydratase [Coriobacteriales bacterium]